MIFIIDSIDLHTPWSLFHGSVCHKKLSSWLSLKFVTDIDESYIFVTLEK
jgi:hypothetical protein